VKPVLLIDDEPGIADLVSLCLDPVEVVTASDLTSAVDAARRDEFGLILLDVELAEQDGLEILPRLRQEASLRSVPVVAFTAHDSRRREAFDLGVVSFVRRPFSSLELRTAVEQHILP
jgi:CheY-like chemotaxis protein